MIEVRYWLLALAIGFLLVAACTRPEPTPTVTPTPTPTTTPIPVPSPESTRASTPTSSTILTPTPIAVTADPLPAHGFIVGGTPFQFLGANVDEQWIKWSKVAADDLVKSAKAHGISVLVTMLPWFEETLGSYNEAELVKLDHLLDTASRNGVYVTLPFVHAYGISLSPGAAYYHPGGIEGLVKDTELKEAFRKRMAAVITRVNTINGRKYSEDPTILAWMLVQELVSAPENYPGGAPKVTVEDLTAWVEEMASYVKSLDANHLVTMNVHSGISKVGEDWFKILTVPSLDFVQVEDAEARFLYVTPSPVEVMVSFTGGALDQATISSDYSWQSQTLRKIFATYYEMGVASGFTVFSWASELTLGNIGKKHTPSPYTYTASNTPIAQTLLDIASTLGSRNSTSIPLQFVKLNR